MMNQEQKNSWWSRNWKWVVPVGGLAVLVLLAGLFAMIVYVVFSFVKSSEIYQEAIAKAKVDSAVIEALGSPIKGGFFVTGNMKISGPSGEADLSIPISGPKGKGKIYAVAKKSADKWTFSTLEVAIKASGERINLLFTDTGTYQSYRSVNTGCPVPGKLIHWQAAYCMWLNETDDFLEASVQKCFNKIHDEDANSHLNDCEKKKYYRRKLCELLVHDGYFLGTVFDCMKSKATIPRPVREGGI